MVGVVSVAGKGGVYPPQVCFGKANASEPLMTYRKEFSRCCRNQGGLHSRDKAQRKPVDWLGGNR
jgi:hypothetical protein